MADLTTTTSTGGLKLSPFSPENLAKAIHDSFAGVPEGHKNAVIGYWTTSGQYRVTVARRVGDSWEFGATFGKDSTGGGISGGIYMKGSF